MSTLGRLLSIAALLLALFVFTPISSAEDTDPADINAYIQLVEQIKNERPEKQIELLRSFLEENPDTSFRKEIESNLHQLEELQIKTDPKRRKESQDAERFLRAVEFANSLSPTDKIALWEQFIEENPESLYRDEAEANLEELKAKHGRSRIVPPESEVPNSKKVIPVATTLPLKNRKTATLLATFPGLVVPGMGHWYTGEYVTAGILSAIRLAAVAIGVPGIIKNNKSMIILGSVGYVATYLIDVIDTPFAVDRYNIRMEKKKATLSPFITYDRVAGILFSSSF